MLLVWTSFYFMLLLQLIMMMNADGDNSVIMNEDW